MTGRLRQIRARLIRYPGIDRAIRRTAYLLRQRPWVYPRSIVEDARVWIEQQRRHAARQQRFRADWWRDVYPEAVRIYEPPAATEGARQILDQALDHRYARWIPPARLFCFTGAYLIGAEGAVLSRDNRFFAEFTYHADGRVRDNRYLGPFATVRREEQRIRDWVALLAAPATRTNYFHCLFDLLPRIHLLGDARVLVQQYAVPDLGTEAQWRSLERLGIPAAQILPLQEGSKIYCDRLLVPSLTGGIGAIPPWVVTFLRDAFCTPDAIARPRRRLYVSRGDAPHRRIVNEDALADALGGWGFETVRLGELPFDEQVRLFEEAEIVVGAHGAGLANLVFARDCTIIEIFVPDYLVWSDCFFTLARLLGHPHVSIVGEPSGSGPGDVRVSVPAVLAAVAAADRRPHRSQSTGRTTPIISHA